jgi:trigger factor
MQTSLETLGELERRLTMSVPVAQIEREIAQRLARLAKNTKVPGFRPGKVPMKMVAQQYGPQVRSDVISDAVKATFTDALREQNLRIAGYPRIEPKTEAATPDLLEFSAVFEVYPEVRIGDLSDVTVERPLAHVGPDDVEQTIAMLRRQRTRYERVARGAATGDRVVVDFSGTIDGVAFPGGQASDFSIVLGEGRMLPEFETAVAAMKEGESTTFGLTFPADYHGKEVAGKIAQFSLTVKSVEAGHLPELDGDFVRTFGVASGELDDLKAEIASNLGLELKRKIETAVKAEGDVHAAEVAGRDRGAEHGAAHGGGDAGKGHAGRGNQSHAGHVSRERRDAGRAGADPVGDRARRRPERKAGAGEGAPAGGCADL